MIDTDDYSWGFNSVTGADEDWESTRRPEPPSLDAVGLDMDEQPDGVGPLGRTVFGLNDLIAILASMLVREASETGSDPATLKSVGMGDEATNNRVGLQRSAVRTSGTQSRSKLLIASAYRDVSGCHGTTREIELAGAAGFRVLSYNPEFSHY